MATVNLQCTFGSCDYATGDKSEMVACTLLNNHTATHQPASRTSGNAGSGAPKLERPKVDVNINPEDWNLFKNRLDVFLKGSSIADANVSSHIFQCASEHNIFDTGSIQCPS